MKLISRRTLAGAALALGAATAVLTPMLAQAQAPYPNRPVRLLVPFGPGTGTDVMARAIADRLSQTMGQQFVVENRPGAAGTIAGAAVASAAPDGYTLMLNASSQTTTPALMKNLPYDGQGAFIGVAMLAESSMVLVSSKTRGLQTVKDVVAFGKANPGALTYGSAGAGSTTHLSMEKFRVAGGIQGVHVPFKSTTDAMTELMAGRLDLLYTSLPGVMAAVKDGRINALAMGERRTPLLPGVATMAEAGLPAGNASLWFGIFAPARTPRDIVNRLHAEVAKAQADPAFKERLARAGGDPWPMSVDEFNALLKREFGENEQLVKAIGLKME